MAVVKAIDGKIVEGPMSCPKSITTDEGRTILGFNKMTDDQRRLFNYYPVKYPDAGRFQTYDELTFENEEATYSLKYIEVDQIKFQLHEERKQRRIEKEVEGFIFRDHLVASDRDSVMRINNAATAAMTVGPSFSTVWECADNYNMELDQEGVLQMQVALAMHGQACHDWSKQKEIEINEAETPEQLSQIEF